MSVVKKKKMLHSIIYMYKIVRIYGNCVHMIFIKIICNYEMCT